MMLRTALQRLLVFAPRDCPPQPATREALRRLLGKAKDLQATAAAEGFHWTELAQATAGFEEGLEVMTMRPTRNRRNMTRSYILSELLDFWVHELGEKPSGKACERFLAACITPVFGPTSAKAVARWLERYHRGEIVFL